MTDKPTDATPEAPRAVDLECVPRATATIDGWPHCLHCNASLRGGELCPARVAAALTEANARADAAEQKLIKLKTAVYALRGLVDLDSDTGFGPDGFNMDVTSWVLGMEIDLGMRKN